MLQRSWPESVQAEGARWLAALQRDATATLTFCYRRPPVLDALRGALLAAARTLEGEHEVLGPMYAERARELELEAALVEHIGGPGFAALAAQRHSPGHTSEWPRAEQIARDWASAAPAVATMEELVLSDDARSPHSLLQLVSAQLGLQRLPFRVQVVRELASRAATGDGVIYVRAGVRLSPRAALRIARHEVLGHALPRAQARSHALGLLRVGSAGAVADEEGRALLIEQRFGDLDQDRQRELGLRHLTALAVASGSGALDCVRLLADFGCEKEHALQLFIRCARGSAPTGRGLCRELEYLPAWLRVAGAFAEDPSLERWLEQGRVSVRSARLLRQHFALEPRPDDDG
ncbi:MAG: hypothetical protein RL033_5236 [Pseudomonadota bacterium]